MTLTKAIYVSPPLELHTVNIISRYAKPWRTSSDTLLFCTQYIIKGAKITSWGVGTHMITSKGWASFGGVYKLAAVMGEDGKFIPKIKISENPEKITNPGNKKIYRVYTAGKIRADLIALDSEQYDESKDLRLYDNQESWSYKTVKAGTFKLRELLEPIFKDGKLVYKSPSVMEIREICKKELETLNEESKRLVNPQEIHVDLSDELYALKMDLLKRSRNE